MNQSDTKGCSLHSSQEFFVLGRITVDNRLGVQREQVRQVLFVSGLSCPSTIIGLPPWWHEPDRCAGSSFTPTHDGIMDNPPITPTASPKGKRRRTSKTVASPQTPSMRERDDRMIPSEDDVSPMMLHSPGDDPDEVLWQDSTVDTTEASELTPVGVKTSPELVAAVQSFDSLLASQNDTLGSLMHSPTGAGSPGDADDDDDLELELERLARDNELFRKELNILAAVPERKRQAAAAPPSPLQGIPESPLRIPPQHSTPQQPPRGVREEVKLELSESPIPPGGSNVNTPDLTAAIRRFPSPAKGDEQTPIQTVMDDDHDQDVPEQLGTYSPQSANVTNPAAITPTPHSTATVAAATTTATAATDTDTANNSGTSSSSKTPVSSADGTSESSTTVVFDESGNKTTSSSSSSGGKALPSSSSSSSTANSIRLELSGETSAPHFGSGSSPASPLHEGGLPSSAERTPMMGDPSLSPHARSLATGELIPHPKRSPAEDETKGSTPPEEVAAREKEKIRSQATDQSPTHSTDSPRAQSPGKLRIKSLATGALVQSPSKRHSPLQGARLRSSPPPLVPEPDVPQLPVPIVDNLVQDTVEPAPVPVPTTAKSPQRHLPKARNLFPKWTSSENTASKTNPPGDTTESQSSPPPDEVHHHPIPPIRDGPLPATAEEASVGTARSSAGTMGDTAAVSPTLAKHVPATPTSSKSLVTGAFVNRDPPLPPPPPPFSEAGTMQPDPSSSDVSEPALTASIPPSSLSPDAVRVGTAFGFLGEVDDQAVDASDESDSDDEKQSSSPNVQPSLLSSRPPLQTVRQPSVGDAEVSSSPRPLLDSPKHLADLSNTAATGGLTPSATWDSLADKALVVEQQQGEEDIERLLPLSASPSHTPDSDKGKGMQVSPTASITSGDAAATTPNDTGEADTGTSEPSDRVQERRKFCSCLRSGMTCVLVAVLIISLAVLVATTVVLIGQREGESSNVNTFPPSSLPSHLRTPVPGMTPTRAPSSATSMPQIMTSPPPTYTAAPSMPTVSQDLFDYLVSISPDGGVALHNKTSPQYLAFLWLAGNEGLANYSPMRLRQRYTLATFYYSTNGDQWNVRTNWLTNENECNWFSRAMFQTICGPNSEFQRLELSYNNLDGVIPPELSLLSDTLQNMSLSGGPTRYLTGSIPTYIGRLSNLWNLRLWNNRLSGTVITEIGTLSKLRYLDLSLNRLSGSLATEIGQLRNLTWLDCSNNGLSGRLPVQLGQLSNLKFMDMSFNGFSGPIPTSLGNLTTLTTLNLNSNKLTRIHSNVGLMQALESLSLANNSLASTIPDSIGRLFRLQNLNVSQNFLSGTMPSTMGRLRQLTDGLDVSNNRLTGTLPPWVGELDGSLRTLLLHRNDFRGPIPDTLALLTSVTLVRLDANQFTGAMPQAVCQVFDVTQPSLFADCGELDCPCCNYCCTDSGCTCRYEGTGDQWRCFY